ncbi:MAG: DUF261 family protein [Treponemataceae bacterium]
MNALKQNDKSLMHDIQEVGCYFRSAQFIAENKTGTCLTAQQINAMWLWANEKGVIKRRVMVQGAAPIANRTLKILGDSGRFVEVGTFQDGTVSYYNGVHYGLQRIDALIQKVKQPAGSVYPEHFRVVDKFGTVIFDPYEPPLKNCTPMYSILFAYLEE